MPERRTFDDAASKTALYWVARTHSGDCTEQERSALEQWLAHSEANRLAYREAAVTWDGMETLRPALDAEMLAARAYRYHGWRRHMPAAAAALVLIAVAIPLWTWWFTKGETTAYSTAKKEQKYLQLPDGSAIDMNTYTELTVTFSRRSRTVQLQRGEALFTVAKDDTRPFEVIAGNGRIRDIGTRFNVHNKEELTAVGVVEGEVAVTTGRSQTPLHLSAGQQLSYTAAGEIAEIARVDIEEITAWRDGLLMFKDDTLQEVTKELSHYYDLTILIDDPELRQLRISGTFRLDKLDGLLTALAAMLPIEPVMKENGLLVLKRKDPAG